MKVVVIGHDHMEGISQKTNKPYAIGRVFAAVKIDGKNAKGAQGTEYAVEPEVIKKISHLPLPFEADLVIEDVMRFGKRETKVLDVQPLARVQAAPGSAVVRAAA